MDLPALWKEQQLATFPAACLGRSAGGIGLLKLDAGVGALLTACLRQDGLPRVLSGLQRSELERQRPLLEAALADAGPTGEGRRYFERLHLLADHVLRA